MTPPNVNIVDIEKRLQELEQIVKIQEQSSKNNYYNRRNFGRFPIICHYCGRQGHIAPKCRISTIYRFQTLSINRQTTAILYAQW